MLKSNWKLGISVTLDVGERIGEDEEMNGYQLDQSFSLQTKENGKVAEAIEVTTGSRNLRL